MLEYADLCDYPFIECNLFNTRLKDKLKMCVYARYRINIG